MTFPLLADPDSEVIRRFGILNTLIAEDDHPWHGIPFPGSYVIDGDGVVTAKFFENRLQFRASAAQLLRSALGEQIDLPALETDPASVAVDVRFDGGVFHPGIVHDLVVRLAVPPGQHLYGEPVPDGMVATSVEIDAQPGLLIRDPVLPPTSPHTLQGTGETLQIFEGDVTIRIPVAHLGRALIDHESGQVQRITGSVRWQSCDDHTCHLPQRQTFSLDVPATQMNRPERDRDTEGGMDVATHLIGMVARRTDEPVSDIFARMTDPPD